MSMSANDVRAFAPTGTDRRVSLTDGRRLHVTVIEHSTDGFYAGSHPHFLFVRYADVKAIHPVAR